MPVKWTKTQTAGAKPVAARPPKAEKHKPNKPPTGEKKPKDDKKAEGEKEAK